MLKAIGAAWLIATAVAVSGCAGDINKAPVTKQMRVSGDLEDVYYKLTAGAPSDSDCIKWIVRSAIYPKKGEFKIEYGPQSLSGPQIFSSIVGSRNGESVDLTMRDSTWIKNSPYIKAVSNYLESGVCR
ncbi:hypothetical protein [Pseudomonas putida]|uniref:Lipoprotein n=1 Tax=Pseudomonas putida TaxID=303 RepID=A0A2S3WFP0_PSEPU|nr:hypothetical protein [Pseudomonas putida]POF89760.1 hypothetical protein BGP80_18050 [Pseudomonas putida]